MNIVPIIKTAGELASKTAGGQSVMAVETGWTPTAYMLLVIIIMGFISFGLGYLKVKPALDKIKTDSDADVRRLLIERVAALEKSSNDTATRHTEAINLIKTEHAEEITRIRHDMLEQHRACEEENRALRDQVTGLQRMMITWQITSGQAMPLNLTPETRKMVDKLVAAMDGDTDARQSLIDIIGGEPT